MDKYLILRHPILGDDLIRLVLMGGFPVNIDSSEAEREIWADNYTKIFMERDLRDIADLDQVTQFTTSNQKYRSLFRSINKLFPTGYKFWSIFTNDSKLHYLVRTVIAYHNFATLVHKRIERLDQKLPSFISLTLGLLAVTSQINFDGIKRVPDKLYA